MTGTIHFAIVPEVVKEAGYWLEAAAENVKLGQISIQKAAALNKSSFIVIDSRFHFKQAVSYCDGRDTLKAVWRLTQFNQLLQ